MDEPSIQLYDGMSLSWDHDGHEYGLKISQVQMPAAPWLDGMVYLGTDPDTVIGTSLFWGDKARRSGLMLSKDVETALRAVLPEVVSDREVLEWIRSGPARSQMKIEESDGLFDIYRNTGSAGSPQWELKYLGVEPDGLIASIEEDLSASWCLGLIPLHAEILSLYIDDDHGLKTGGRDSVVHADGLIYVSKDTVLSKTGCRPEEWRDKAVSALELDAYRHGSYLKGDVFHCTRYHRYGATWRKVARCGAFYGADVARNGLAYIVGHGLEEALAEGRVRI